MEWLYKILDYLIKNKEWIFSGVGISVAAIIVGFISWLFMKKYKNPATKNIQIIRSNVHKGLSGNEVNQIVQTLMSKSKR